MMECGVATDEDAITNFVCDDCFENMQRNHIFIDPLSIKACPSCNVEIEKDGGCDHMSCRCGADWCWICRKLLKQGKIYEHILDHISID